MTFPPPSLTLDQCVKTLKNHLPDVSKAQPKDMARLYVASVALLCHLKKDAATLEASHKSTGDKAGFLPCPPAQDIPAITRVHQDSQLFQALVACLKVPEDDTSATPRYSRKRSYSFQQPDNDSTPANKLLKVQHSPTKKISARPSAEDVNVPRIPLPVLAATVLYSAFQHVDHWPVQLVRSYAEDSFGPRLWVDDERCSLLVQNLSLSHDDKEPVENVDQATLAQAARVAIYYENILSENATNGNLVPRQAVLTPQPGTGVRKRSMSLGSAADPPSTSAVVQSDSDSDSGDECLIEVTSGLLERAGNGGGDDSDSSSSGEEDMEVVEMSTTLEGGPLAPPNHTMSLTSRSISSAPQSLSTFPGTPTALNLDRVRRRYFGVNLNHAHNAIATALSERLDLKSKQNSKLLMALPSFVSIPAIRRLTTQHLERWLQSPALSGQARTLFAATVQNMLNVDPPLPDDIEAIDNIMEMRLKTNQLNMHTENVTEIANRIGNATVARHIFIRILREELTTMESGTHLPTPTEPMKMMNAVYGAFPSDLACEGLAIAFLTLLSEPAETSQGTLRELRQHHVKKIRLLLRSVASALGSKFDGCGLIESLLSFDVKSQSWSLEDEKDKARLMFECATLIVPLPDADDTSKLRHKGQRNFHHRYSGDLTDQEIVSLRQKLRRARRLLLDWCCTEFAEQWQMRQREQQEHDKLVEKRLKKGKRDEIPAGAGTPDFSSVLDGEEGSTKFSDCLDIMRCVLFMADADSTILRDFLYPNESSDHLEPASSDDRYRIQKCNEYGSDLDDDMLSVILKSAMLQGGGIDHPLALSLIESLFECCSKDRKGALLLADSKLVSELYLLSEYRPSPPQVDAKAENGHTQNGTMFPRLSHPGLWWRITALVLIMCGESPHEIGTLVWNDYPTLRALIKMVTSGRYRFPTIDCDEGSRSKMKEAEAKMRDEECRIAEELFLPFSPKPKKPETSNGVTSPEKRRGTRVSSRQREKQERLLRQRREKEAADALVEAEKRKKRLRAAQRSIMLWDPKGPTRKPPKEAVPLILSVEKLFCLSEAFQQSIDPDFLLMTIGQTTRGAIERAFDWVIPVISSVPEIINRLPANASCFLLLRAYGDEGEGKSELRKLSSPLVQHVKNSLTGEFGESSAFRTADLLLTDLADPNPDRRRCVIRVLTETLGHVSAGDNDDDATGLLCLLQVNHAEAIVSGAIKYISQGLAFERGNTLRALVIALDKYISFASERKVEGSWNFPFILCNLISSRHLVCSEAMDRFPDFRELAITLVHREFLAYANKVDDDEDSSERVLVELYPTTKNEEAFTNSVSMPPALLQSACVLLSICKDKGNSDLGPAAITAIQYLADTLMHPCDGHEMGSDKLVGLASATTGSGERAVNVEQWIMLAKSRSDFIARRAALSAPTIFLPRLLLCSGLPTSSLITMVDRLGTVGDKAEDRSVAFKDLLMPSTTNQWATLYPISRKELVRKLVARLSAYLRLNEKPLDDKISSSFVEWLWDECSRQKKRKKLRTSKKAPKADQSLLGPFLSSTSGGHIISTLSSLDLNDADDVSSLAPGTTVKMEPFPKLRSREPVKVAGVTNEADAEAFVETCCSENRAETLNDWLGTLVNRSELAGEGIGRVSVCVSLLNVFFNGKYNDKDWFVNTILKWVPLLTQLNGTPDLWNIIFSPHGTQASAELLRNKCAAVWSHSHTKTCQEWILSNHAKLCIPSVLRFLIATCYQPTVHAHTFITSKSLTEDYWGSSESGLEAGVTIAIKGAKERSSVYDVNDAVNLPDWLVMILLLARTRQVSMTRVCKMLLTAVEQEENEKVRSRLQSAILRLYTYYPKKMKLGDAKLRGVLMEGAKSGRWLDWRSSLDSQLEDMLSSLKSNPSKRIVQALVDLSKAHPLLVLRKLPDMMRLLEEDACCVPKFGCPNSRGRIYGENLMGPLTASIGGKAVKVTIRHWGYAFTESLWLSLLDVLVCIPKEVLFSCGSHMRLGEVLSVYARLLFIQSQLQSNSARIKTKFSDFLNIFKSTDRKGWEAWLDSKQPALPSLDTTRNVLMSCSLITPEPSVEDLRRAMKS